jgi:hypothetical protein
MLAPGISRIMRRTLALLFVALFCFNDTVGAQSADPMAPVAVLEGGTWLGEGKWPDGSALRVEVRYFWGPTKRVLHFETFDLASGQRKLIYEGILFFNVKRGKILQYNFKPTGEFDESELSEATSKGYEVRGANTRSLIHYTSANEFLWELRVLQAGEWKVILDAKYRRGR